MARGYGSASLTSVPTPLESQGSPAEPQRSGEECLSTSCTDRSFADFFSRRVHATALEAATRVTPGSHPLSFVLFTTRPSTRGGNIPAFECSTGARSETQGLAAEANAFEA
ncbi:hypothetical protein SAMD00023353_1101070 [Rosellinia necatrix]|uniref:Uncharacterized protein n=1 Tax=Rosellinia necatrix TaxID=77044 RepID=A0A1S8A6G0_ROSNE|nr:hypothetical protein SAMD00023353_1101070 [Rosellinia necatrix]